MRKRDIIMRDDFDLEERRIICEAVWEEHTAADVIEALARNCMEDESDRPGAVAAFTDDLRDFEEEWADWCVVYDAYDVGDEESEPDRLKDMMLNPSAFFLWVCRRNGWDPYEELLRFGYHLLQVDEGIPRGVRPRCLGKKRRDPKSELDYDAVGW